MKRQRCVNGSFPAGWCRIANLRLSPVLGLGLLLSAATTCAQPVPDRDTLLIAQFDSSVGADYALGSPAADTQVEPTGSSGGRFGGGVDLAAGERISLVGDDGNFNLAEGTIEFWIKPHWKGDDSEKHSFFNCHWGEKGYINLNTLGQGRVGIALSSGQGNDWTWRRTDGDISAWEPDTWHHLAFSWGGGGLHTYVDGLETGRPVTDARMPDELPATLEIIGGDAVIDAFSISKRRYSADDARRSIEQALRPPYRRVTDLEWTAAGEASAGGRTLLGDLSIPLILGDTRYADGIACSMGTDISVPLDEPFQTFEAAVGVCALSPAGTACAFEVLGDGKKLLDVRCTVGEPPRVIRVPIVGVKHLVLSTPAMSGAVPPGHAIWAGPVVTRDADALVVRSPQTTSAQEIDMYRRQQEADCYRFALETDRPFVVAGKYWEDDLDPTTAPALEAIGRRLEAFAAPGEYEPVNFVVYAAESLENVSVELGDLRSGDSVLPASCFDVRLVLRALTRDVYTFPAHRSTVVSRFLLPYRELDIPAGTFREYHMIVGVPEDSPPGKYAGTVRIAAADRPAFELPLVFEVLPFHLEPPAGKQYGVYYRFPGMEEDWSPLEVELADIREHGGTMLKSNLAVQFERVDAKVQPSFAMLERGLALLKKHGYHGPLPVSTGCEQAARLLGYHPSTDGSNDIDRASRERFMAVVKDAMKRLVELGAEYPEFELMPTHMDEIFGRDRLERYIALTEAVRQVPSLRVYITLHNDPARDVSELMRRCDPFVDVRCYNGHCMDNYLRAGNTFDDLRRELDAAGDEAWLYHNIRGSFFPAEWTRLVNGYYLWISPLKIHVPWMYYAFKGNPFDATDGPYERGGDFAYAVPDPHDPARMIPTRHWEGFREGIDDLRYLSTLETAIEKHPGTPEAQAAARWLTGLRTGVTPGHADLEPIEEESPVLVFLAKKLDGADYRRIRRQAADHILRLREL